MTGKSRLIKEVIPYFKHWIYFCYRQPGSSGYPNSRFARAINHLIEQKHKITLRESLNSCFEFTILIAIFCQVTQPETFQEVWLDSSEIDAERFVHYCLIVALKNKLQKKPVYFETIKKEYKTLVDFLNDALINRSTNNNVIEELNRLLYVMIKDKIQSQKKRKLIEILFVFDESDILFENQIFVKSSAETVSFFRGFRSALQNIGKNIRIFGVLLSTNSKMSELAPTPVRDASLRNSIKRVINPIIEIPYAFDIFKSLYNPTLSPSTSYNLMCFGRPMWYHYHNSSLLEFSRIIEIAVQKLTKVDGARDPNYRSLSGLEH
ncbi:uncharacterized protein ASCRUDRAFT_69879 [Ascoidea rubescens DSM 1968]|uniref:Uncharacterized protein n=1 Tax=Ascoidea rubescens DSM 1968 TaxID=1344418 RepID=A0A1D2VIA1_9ASCO|nr:hypothetical protein ASCRUDRAFT_69879 [Ascoidea rubescens DSM 1968]ODV61374.1 hypothetical protein ASCRUDRAFT_69879 [Ascoidea rubescens DSM 1968]